LQYQLDSKAGSLVELVGGKVISYDLTGLSPQIVDTFKSRETPQAVVQLSSSILLAASLQKFSIYDSKFGSLLATQSIPPTPAPTTKKKAALEAGPPPPVHFIGYLKQSGKVVALRGTELLAVQISEAARSNKRKKSGTLLIDSLAKGSLGSRLRSKPHEAKGSQKKRKRTTIGSSALFTSPELDTLFQEGKIEEFEKQLAAAIGLYSAPKLPKVQGDGENGESRAVSTLNTEWKLPNLNKLRGLATRRPQALYALSKLFEPSSSQSNGESKSSSSRQSSIQLKSYPENVFLWLVHTGQLRADLIQRALSEYDGFDRHIPHGDLVLALAAFDNDLSLVHYVLTYHPNLHAEEVVMAIKLIINSLDNSTLPQPEHRLLMDNEFAAAAATTGALTNGVGVGIGPVNAGVPQPDGQIDNKEATMEQQADIESVTDAAMKDVDELMEQVYQNLDQMAPIRGETLRQALTRLNALPREDVTQTLRRMLTQHELVFLIHILRVELDQGGWTTRYLDREDFDTAEEPSNTAITVIANMLSWTVDAVGMTGWLTTSASDPFDSIDETLNLLRGEISNTLEGVHEATFISSVLADFLRYSHRLGESSNELSNHRKSSTLEKDEEMWKRGKTVIVEDAPSSHLPMGLGVGDEQGIRTVVAELEMRHISGLVQKKTGRDVGREIRRGLPAYVFERIRF
jgi:hypothetical protein